MVTAYYIFLLIILNNLEDNIYLYNLFSFLYI